MLKAEKDFEVELENFKGPLSLLLELIEKRKLSINSISLSKVADDFLEATAKLKLEKDDLADFLLLCATLILIKSRSLLPELALSEEDEKDIDELQERLKALKSLRAQKKKLMAFYHDRVLELKALKLFAPRAANKSLSLDGFEKEQMQSRLLSILDKAPLPKDKVFKKRGKMKKIKDLSQFVAELEMKIRESFKIEFSQVAGKDKLEIVSNFLALLELVKRGVVEIEQKEHFGEIKMEERLVSVPRYG